MTEQKKPSGSGPGEPPRGGPGAPLDGARPPWYRRPASGSGPNGGSGRRETLRLVTHFSAGALELGVSVAIGAGLGYWLDSVFDTAPWLTLFWLLCGVGAGFRSLYRLVKRLEASESGQDREDRGEKAP